MFVAKKTKQSLLTQASFLDLVVCSEPTDEYCLIEAVLNVYYVLVFFAADGFPIWICTICCVLSHPPLA